MAPAARRSAAASEDFCTMMPIVSATMLPKPIRIGNSAILPTSIPVSRGESTSATPIKPTASPARGTQPYRLTQHQRENQRGEQRLQSANERHHPGRQAVRHRPPACGEVNAVHQHAGQQVHHELSTLGRAQCSASRANTAAAIKSEKSGKGWDRHDPPPPARQ